MLGAEEGAARVRAVDPVPVVRVEGRRAGVVLADADVVVQHVDAVETRHAGLRDRPARRLVEDVGLHRLGLAALAANDRGRRLGGAEVAVHEQDAGAVTRE